MTGSPTAQRMTSLHKASWGFLVAFDFIWYFGRGERIRTSGLYVPNAALYLTKLHPDAV